MLAITTKSLNLLSNRYFWALLLIIIGVSIVLVQLLNVPISVFRLVVTTVLVTAGIQLVLKSANFKPKLARPSKQSLLIGSGTNIITQNRVKSRYYNILGSQILDFRSLNPAQKLTINIHTLLGETHLYLPSVPKVQITSHKVLGSIAGNISSGSVNDTNPVLLLDLHTVMGNVTIHRAA
jgi:predicted membrane protein